MVIQFEVTTEQSEEMIVYFNGTEDMNTIMNVEDSKHIDKYHPKNSDPNYDFSQVNA